MRHSKFSPSASSRWLECPGSIPLSEEVGVTQPPGAAAIEGTIAHSYAEKCLKAGSMKPIEDDMGTEKNGVKITSTMHNSIVDYLNHINGFSDRPGSVLFVENELSFENIVKGGFGTCDAAVVNTTEEDHFIDIFDFKYGRSIKVSAEYNTQMMIYIIAFRNTFPQYKWIKRYRVHIIQPRMSNISTWKVTHDELVRFARKMSAAIADSQSVKPAFKPGEKQCMWCPAKQSCPTFFDDMNTTILSHLNKIKDVSVNDIPDEQLVDILSKKKMYDKFYKDIEERMLSRMMRGESITGLKLIHSRSIRRWREGSMEELESILGESAFVKKPINITEAQTLLDEDVLDRLTHRPDGKPKVVPEDTKGKGYAIG